MNKYRLTAVGKQTTNKNVVMTEEVVTLTERDGMVFSPQTEWKGEALPADDEGWCVWLGTNIKRLLATGRIAHA